MGTLTVCMITKNSAGRIGAALESALKVADEIIVTDTGSTDHTVSICHGYGSKVNVNFFTWVNDFSAARNFGLQFATSDWVVWLDDDDRIGDLSAVLINHLKTTKPDRAFLFKLKNENPVDKSVVVHEWAMQIRMWPNHRMIRFEKALHETVVNSISSIGIPKLCVDDVEIIHTGYSNEITLKEKLARNNRLQMAALGANIDNIVTFNCGWLFALYAPACPEFPKIILFDKGNPVCVTDPSQRNQGKQLTIEFISYMVRLMIDKYRNSEKVAESIYSGKNQLWKLYDND